MEEKIPSIISGLDDNNLDEKWNAGIKAEMQKVLPKNAKITSSLMQTDDYITVTYSARGWTDENKKN